MSSAVATRRCVVILAGACAAASAHAAPLSTIDHWVVTPTLSANHLDNGRDDWRASRVLSLLLDHRQLRFNTGSVHEIRPGVIVWFGDATWITLRYADGAFGTAGYQSRSLRLDHVFAGQSPLTLVYAHGADSEFPPLTHATRVVLHSTSQTRGVA